MSTTTAPAVPKWRTHAACRGTVRNACRAHAVDTAEPFGVWGGLAADERPAPPPDTTPAPGPAPKISDDELYDLFYDADPDQAALDQLLAHIWLPNATAYTALQRAVRLGVVEHRGRGLYPVRR
jgi:hypothetical protein